MNRFRPSEPDPAPLPAPASMGHEPSAWAAALAQGDDAAMVAWFAQLPQREPRSGFVLRVMSALPRRSWLDARSSQVLLVAALLTVAVSAGFLIPALVPLVRLVGPAGVLNLWIGSVADLASQMTAGLSIWNTFASVGRVLARALALPPFVALLALNAALALAAFRGLVALSSKRSPSHAGIVALSL
jgi:hypothetical protein